MKFFESMYGELVNVEEISKVTIESNEVSDKYYSYVYLKNGEKIDFINLSNQINVNKESNPVMFKLSEKEYLSMIKLAIEFILACPSPIIHNKSILDYCLRELQYLLS